MREKLIRANLFLGAAVLAGAVLLLVSGSAFMRTWFYLFAWWPFILILDSLNYRKGGASLFTRPERDALFMAFVSVSVWLVFELFNLRLRNWGYHELPLVLWQRWLGYFTAFASVVPALVVLAEFFRQRLARLRMPAPLLKPTPRFLHVSTFLGVMLFAVTLLWPRLFFPCVWLCFIFLLEPLNFRLGNPSLLSDLEQRDGTRFWSWAAAGLTAGFVWEFFNFWAGSHWEYSLPYFEFGRIFQMPVLGYLGFIPFALEVMAIYGLLCYLRRRFLAHRWLAKISAAALLLAFDAVVFALMDKFTWRP
jgi:hypothetical protein